MTARWSVMVVMMLLLSGEVQAQSSSLYLRAREGQHTANGGAVDASEVSRVAPLNPELEDASLIAIKTKPPHEFKPHDLVTVIVREQRSYESDAKLDTKKNYQVKSEIDEFLRFINGHLGAASFTDGKPNIDYSFETRLKGDGDAERNDRLTFRLTVEIVDIKPNGLLVLAGQQQVKVDDELETLNFTGTCRSRDVTPDNTVLSTQVFDQYITVEHQGALRDASRRGWLVKLLDWLNPF